MEDGRYAFYPELKNTRESSPPPPETEVVEILFSPIHPASGIHVTEAFAVVHVGLLIVWYLLQTPFYATTPVILMILICSDYSAVLILEQISYLLDHAFCPWYMIFDFIPFSQFLDELGRFYLGSVYGPDRIQSIMDLLAALMRIPRAIFYSVFINIVFFNLVYKVTKWVATIAYRLMCFAWYLIADFPEDVVRVWFYLVDKFWRFVIRTLNNWFK